MGNPDKHGNYIKVVGNKPTVSFMSHHDTVHFKDGRVSVKFPTTQDGSFARVGSGSCLGADCTTGVYIMLKMMEENIPGVYVIHAAEEIGCVGSSQLVYDYPTWLLDIKYAISFDRKGYNSIISHQMGRRCCSEEFIQSLNNILGGGYFSDDTGSYTDSNEYVGVVPECTNLSVGYFNQHSKNEYQDLDFLDDLVGALIDADWSKLVCKRVPSPHSEFDSRLSGKFDDDMYSKPYGMAGNARRDWEDYLEDRYEPSDIGDLANVIEKYPAEVAEILKSFGYSADGLIDDCEDLLEKSNGRYKGGF
jgi:hypothetical protein